MKGLNRAYLIGNIGQDPELRTTAAGKHFLKLSVATPHGRKVGEEWVETPDWHRLTLFGQQAEYVARYAKKGDLLAVECAIRPGKWTDKDNVVHSEVNLIVDRVLMLQGRNRPVPAHVASDEAEAPRGSRSEPSRRVRAEDDVDEVPF